ncbi:uncharacterized protein RBU33_017978 isoform 3-T3 [Hipposideros larvatus]
MLSDVKETMRKSLDKTYLEWFGRGLGHLPLFQLDFPGRVSQQLETPLAQGQSSFVLLSPLCHLSHPLSLGTLTSSLEPNQGSSAEPSNPIQDTTLYSLFASPSSSPACDKSLRLSWSFMPLALLKNIGQDILIGCTPSFGIEHLAKDGENKQNCLIEEKEIEQLLLNDSKAEVAFLPRECSEVFQPHTLAWQLRTGEGLSCAEQSQE